MDEGPGEEDNQRVFDGQALRFRDKRARLRGSDPGSWPLWLYERLPGGEILARLEALHDRRRNFCDTAHHHRARDIATSWMSLVAENTSLADRVTAGDPGA